MALYQSICPKCQKLHIYRKPINERNETPQCCGVKTLRKLDAPMGTVIGKAAG